MKLKTKWVDSLEKVFIDSAPEHKEINSDMVLLGEKYHVQLAYFTEDGLRDELKVVINSPLKDSISIFEVGSVPVCFTKNTWSDDNYLRTEPGLYPDLLTNVEETVTAISGQWRSIWFEINVPVDAKSGRCDINVELIHYKTKEILASTVFSLDVLPAVLPPQNLIHTEWFHNDCLASYYNVPVFSEEHWTIIYNYMRQAVEYGVNMILTPVFTPPLDTMIGGERPTVQLVDVRLKDNNYHFSFEKLDRYIETALAAGVEYFEISHLFTQWGAKSAPKIVAEINGKQKKIFGWETSSLSGEYMSFLRCFILSLKKHLKDKGVFEKCYFHISDEPNNENVDTYKRVKESISDLLEDCKLIDALSDYSIYKDGVINQPIPAVSEIDGFIAKGYENRWTYYCGDLSDKVTNRAISMPSQRTRIIGFQMFKYGIKGFLHWGYNYWYWWCTQKIINPYICTDAKDKFPAGDAYLVYPGRDLCPVSSIRQVVFYDALQDMRACEKISSLIGFEKVVNVLNQALECDFNFKNYPHDYAHLLKARYVIYQLIKENL